MQKKTHVTKVVGKKTKDLYSEIVPRGKILT